MPTTATTAIPAATARIAIPHGTVRGRDGAMARVGGDTGSLPSGPVT